jgi:hypothetical protein
MRRAASRSSLASAECRDCPLARLGGLEGSARRKPLIYQWSSYKGLHYTEAQAMCAEPVILGGGCSGRTSLSSVRSSLRSLSLARCSARVLPRGHRCGDVHVDHLHSREFVEHGARCKPRCQRLQTTAERGVQAIGEKGDEDMRLDALLPLMMDRAKGEVVLEILKASSTATSCR